VSGVPPPEIAAPPPKLSLHQLVMPHRTFGQLIFGENNTIVAVADPAMGGPGGRPPPPLTKT